MSYRSRARIACRDASAPMAMVASLVQRPTERKSDEDHFGTQWRADMWTNRGRSAKHERGC